MGIKRPFSRGGREKKEEKEPEFPKEDVYEAEELEAEEEKEAGRRYDVSWSAYFPLEIIFSNMMLFHRAILVPSLCVCQWCMPTLIYAHACASFFSAARG
jgi:hypothetical protein